MPRDPGTTGVHPNRCEVRMLAVAALVLATIAAAVGFAAEAWRMTEIPTLYGARQAGPTDAPAYRR
jgi:hypothetical protein